MAVGCSGVSEEDIEAVESDVNELQDVNEIENTIKTYALAMDSLDKETWLGVFSDDLESYAVYQHGVDTPILMLSGTQGEKTTKQVLTETCDMMIFERIEVAQSVLSNIVVEITDPTTATATDYFNHWEIVDPEHPANAMQGYDGDHWYFNSGKHEYELTKEDGKWVITKFRGEMFYSEIRERQDIKLGQ